MVGGTKTFFERFFQIETNAALSGWANSCALATGVLSDRFGRKRLLIASSALFAVTSIGNGMSETFTVFIFWRILGGVAIGLASSLSPIYISEVARPRCAGGWCQ